MNIYTVPHTGTHFLLGMMRRHGIEHTHKHYGNGVDLSGLIISTIRDPWLCYVTHNSRGRPGFKEAWQEFNYVYKNASDLHILPIDTEDRDRWLKKLSNRLGVNLRTTWKPAGSGARIETPKIDLSEIYELEVVKRFYKLPTYKMDYLETMTTQDPIIKRIQMGIDKETIKQSFGLTDKEYDDKLREVEGPKIHKFSNDAEIYEAITGQKSKAFKEPKKRGPKPKKTKS